MKYLMLFAIIMNTYHMQAADDEFSHVIEFNQDQAIDFSNLVQVVSPREQTGDSGYSIAYADRPYGVGGMIVIYPERTKRDQLLADTEQVINDNLVNLNHPFNVQKLGQLLATFNAQLTQKEILNHLDEQLLMVAFAVAPTGIKLITKRSGVRDRAFEMLFAKSVFFDCKCNSFEESAFAARGGNVVAAFKQYLQQQKMSCGILVDHVRAQALIGHKISTDARSAQAPNARARLREPGCKFPCSIQ